MPSLEQVLDLHTKLKDIPHLNLTGYLPEVPLNKILKDLDQFSDADFYPYTNDTVPIDFYNFLRKHWFGMCLIENCKEGRHHIDYLTTKNHSLTFHEPETYKPTDVGKLTPNIIDYLYSITLTPERTRLLRLMPGGSTGWHSHYRTKKSGFKIIKDTEVVLPVIQIPIRTNSRCIMNVSKENPREVKDTEQIKKHYKTGEVWIFNSHHYHDAFNAGDTIRDHIMMYASLEDEILFNAINQAVNDYCGIKL